MTEKKRRILSAFSIICLLIVCAFALSSCYHKHVYGEWSYAVLPTCTEAGVQSRMCTKCEATEERPAEPIGHDEVKHDAVPATCTEKGNEAYVTCSRCDYTTFKETEALGHDEVQHERKQSTCLEKGWTAYVTCSRCDYTTFKELPLSGHQQAVLAAKQPTCTETGLTVGSYCKVCNVTIKAQTVVAAKGHNCKQGICTVCGAEDYTDPDQYASDICYSYLADFEHAEGMQAFYRRLDAVVKPFHLKTSVDLTLANSAFAYFPDVVYYDDLEITAEEVFIAFKAYSSDHPLYYWLEDNFIPASGKVGGKQREYIWMKVNAEFSRGSVRAAINKSVYDSIKSYYSEVKGETSEYQIALAYYEKLAMESSYLNSNAADSHVYAWTSTVAGIFHRKSAVCIGYARAYHLLLNFTGVKCRTVEGHSAGIRHAWNIICLDDGNWYWCDPTWGDQPSYLWGMDDRHFCVNDTQKTDWRHKTASYAHSLGTKNFMNEHIPIPEDSKEVLFRMYDLPARSTEPFKSDEFPILREPFEVDGNTYALVGYKKVQFVKTNDSRLLSVPKTITYKGVEYTVISVGAMLKPGYFDATASVAPAYTPDVILPDSIIYIWTDAVSPLRGKCNVYYEGTEIQWNAVKKSANRFYSANIYYYSETRPTASGNYWHYVNGVATPW